MTMPLGHEIITVTVRKGQLCSVRCSVLNMVRAGNISEVQVGHFVFVGISTLILQ